MTLTNASTYCNPLPLPNYPWGSWSREDKESHWGFYNGVYHDFRECADPSVLFHDGKWYLYPSCGMAWVSDDFVTWRHASMNISDVGYAPTIMAFRDRFYLAASGDSPLYVACDPLGPWEPVGLIRDVHGQPLPGYHDPMYFADDDGRVFLYYGCGNRGIWGVEMDPAQPCRAVRERVLCFNYNPEHEWERNGHFNEQRESLVEGAWMLKANGRYYLTYCAPGTNNRTYAMGAYVGDNPLGPFVYQERNPILRTVHGLVRGPGHGCLVRGPGGTLWAFYTLLACRHHCFERRIGMDPAGFDEHGNLFVAGATDTPQWAPGVVARPECGNAAGLIPLNAWSNARASSFKHGCLPIHALDQSMTTWWEAEDTDREPWLWCAGGHEVCAMRVIWAEPSLDYRKHPQPLPVRYRLECRMRDSNDWTVVLDCSDNTADLMIDYRTFPPVSAAEFRLVITEAPLGVPVGVTDFSLFGRPAQK